jgi:hypothetical protein
VSGDSHIFYEFNRARLSLKTIRKGDPPFFQVQLRPSSHNSPGKTHHTSVQQITIVEPPFHHEFTVLSTPQISKLAKKSTQYIASFGGSSPFLGLLTPYPQSVVLPPLIPPPITTKVIAVIPVGKVLPNPSPQEVEIAQAQEGPDTRFQVLL